MRFGLLGTGYWAAETHAAGMANHPDAEFVGVWGRDPAKAGALADRHQVRAYDQVDDLLADVDAIAVALPPDVQAELAIRAASAGKHLLLDKPIALSTASADRVVTAVADAGVASAVFFTNRYRPVIADFLRELVESGPWDGARVAIRGSIFSPDSPYAASAWRKEWGGLWDVGPHALSLLLPVLGPVVEVTALAGPHDTAHALLRHAGGAVSDLTLTLDAPPASTLSEYVFHGAAGFATAPESWDSVEAFRTAVTQLVATAAAGTHDHPCDVRFGHEVVAILDDVQTALREHRVVQR